MWWNYKIINSYKIKLYCKNGDEIKNLSFEEFSKYQNIDESKIICDECKKINKGNTFQKIFYKCNTCKKNLCPLCKSDHKQQDNIINYDLKNFIYEIHNEKCISYCKKCKRNICVLCMNSHKKHEIDIYKIPDKNKKISELNELRKKINEFNKDIEKIRNIVNLVYKNIAIYFDICNDYINNYDISNMNYEKLENMNKIINEDIVNDINIFIKEYNINNKFKKIIEINNKIKKDQINYEKIQKNVNKKVNEDILNNRNKFIKNIKDNNINKEARQFRNKKKLPK